MIFQQTCFACPEQYDVFSGGDQVGYIRLRWGKLSCEAPEYGGETVYTHDFCDEFKGIFDTEDERELFLDKCAAAINEHLGKTAE